MKTKFSGILTLFLAFIVQISFAQDKTVSGVVTDENGLPLPTANVVVAGTSNGTSTDFDGGYTINVNVGEKLQFSYVGYSNKEITVGSSNTINISLQPDNALEEVVIVGYNTTSRAKVNGSISTVTSEKIEQVPIASFDQILQGRAPGVQISSGSGQPGSAAKVRIRGNGSINGSNEPLYLLDGIQISAGDYAALNPNDFSDISILKDASATAQYGSRGANGVILITSKKGTYGDKTTFTYRTQFGFSEVGDSKTNLMNSSQLLNFQRLIGRGRGAGLTDAEISEIAKTNTNWADVFFRTAKTNSHELSITGGSEKTRFYSSLSYFDQEGIAVRSNLKRFTLRNNFENKASDNLKIGLNTSIGFAKSDFIDSESAVALQNPYAAVYLGSPYDTPYNSDGSYNTGNGLVGGNALENLYENGNDQNELKLVISGFIEKKLFKNITAKVSGGVDYSQETEVDFADPNTYYGSIVTPGEAGDYGERNSYDAFITSNASLNYNNTFGEKHTLGVGLYTEYVKRHFRSSSLRGYGINPLLVGYANSPSEGTSENELIPLIGGVTLQRGLFSYFSIVNYDYDSKYGISLSARRDASSKFADGNKWATFYSVGGFWNISNEEFLKNNSTLNFLKLRASYGKDGNQDAIADYSDSTELGQVSYNGNTGLALGRIGNPDLVWESAAKFNVGLDFGLFNNKVSGTLEYYNFETEDLFVDYTLSATSGAGSLQANSGSMRNSGFEVQISADVLQTEDWNINVFGNMNYNKNEILDLGQVNEFELGTSVIREGLPLNSHFAVGWAGVNPANGEPLYYDLDGNVTNQFSDANATADWGSSEPVYTGGFGTTISYKGFELSTLFSFAAEYFRFNNQTFFQENPNFSQYNLSTSMLDMWQQPGDVTDVQSYLYNREFSSKDIEDASFTRWRNLTLAYNLPSKHLDKIKYISGLRIYAQAQNLYTWTNFTGFDPEDDNNIAQYEYPTPRTLSLGFDLKF